jgi:hypothetical protein
MASSINASLTAGLVQTADTSGIINLQSGGTTVATISSTGAAVTGTLSSTGNTTLGDASTDTLNVGNGDLIKDASGNLGIGVTPSAWYTASGFRAMQIGLYGFTSVADGGSAYTSRLMNNSYYNSSAIATFAGANYASEYRQNAGNHSWYSSTASGTAGNPITFTQAMTLDASGNLSVSGTNFTLSPNGAANLHLGSSTGYTSINSGGAGSTLYMNGLTRGGPTNSTTASGAVVFATNELFAVYNGSVSAVRMQVDTSSNLTIAGTTATKAAGTTWANPSDIRLKDNVTDYSKGLAELMQVNVKEWTYNGKCNTTEGMKGLGVIADEVMEVLPNTVDTYQAKLNADDETDTDIKKFDATEITWLMLNSIKEQQALITSLTARLDEQQAQISVLQGAK